MERQGDAVIFTPEEQTDHAVPAVTDIETAEEIAGAMQRRAEIFGRIYTDQVGYKNDVPTTEYLGRFGSPRLESSYRSITPKAAGQMAVRSAGFADELGALCRDADGEN